MDIGKAFGFVFEDEEWVSKVLIGGLIFLIPIIGQLVVLGYSIQVARNVALNNPRPLPTWSEFGDHLVRGLYAFVIQLVYSIPILIIVALFYCVFFGVIMASGGNEEAAGALAGVVSICGGLLIMLLAFAVAIVSYAGLARYAATDSLSEALKFGEVFANVRSNASPWLILFLVIVLSGLLASIGLIACGIGVLFTAMIAYCVQGHAIGQTIRSTGMLGETAAPVTPAPPSTY